ncbi:hypothetical protein ACFE04_006149 [Oxalis oulophora]
MSGQLTKSSKPIKPPQPTTTTTTTQLRSSSSSSLSTHLAMVELKQKILTSISKLGDRDTYQIALEDLEKTIQSLSHESIPMLLNCLYDHANSDPKPAIKKESIRLLAFVCNSFPDFAHSHLNRIIGSIVKRLKDADSGVKEACQSTIGALAGRYLRKESGSDVVGLFVKPLFEAMGEQNKGLQAGAALCMVKVVEGSQEPPVAAFQKLCPRVCKLLNSPNFMAKASLLPVVGSLSQAGAITPQSLEALLQILHDCLGSTDWATRKASADALSALATHSRYLIGDNTASTLTIKPVRDSITEALQLWTKMAGQGETGENDQKTSPNDGGNPISTGSGKNDQNLGDGKTEVAKLSPSDSSPPSGSKRKVGTVSDKAVVILKKKAPALSDKEINPEFFQKLEKRGFEDLPVEVVVPTRRFLNSSNSNNGEESEPNDSDLRGRSLHMERRLSGLFSKQQGKEERVNGKDVKNVDDKNDTSQRELSGNRVGLSRSDGQADGSSASNKGNWLAIQRQLMQLERQQTHLMNMLQDFMGGSHDSMITLENRVRGLERVVEDMARDLSISSGRRGGNSFGMGFDGPSNRPPLGKYNTYQEYPSKYNGRIPFSNGNPSGIRGRGPNWRSDAPDAWDFTPYSRNGQAGPRRGPGAGPPDVRSPKAEHENDQASGRRGWEKGVGPIRLGEGPSARSVWQASKDEATLEAIRVAGEDGGTTRAGTRVAIPELTAEAMGDDNNNIGRERDPIWNSWTNAMDALQVGDIDLAYSEVVSTGDDFLLVKLVDKTGPAFDQLTSETANEVLHAIGQFLLEQNLFDISLSWIQQLVEIVLENGADVFAIPMDLKKDVLLNLHEASSTMDPPEDWEGASPDQLLLQLAAAWGIEVQQHDK